MWCCSDWPTHNDSLNVHRDGDLGLCLIHMLHKASSSRQRHNEGQIHTPFDILPVWKQFDVACRQVHLYYEVQTTRTCSWRQIELLLDTNNVHIKHANCTLQTNSSSASIKGTPTLSIVTLKRINGFWRFLAQIFLKQLAIKWLFNFPPQPKFVSLLQAILTSLFFIFYVVHPISFHFLFSFTTSFTCVIL